MNWRSRFLILCSSPRFCAKLLPTPLIVLVITMITSVRTNLITILSTAGLSERYSLGLQTHSSDEIGKSRICAQIIPTWVEFEPDQPVRAFLVSLLQPGKSL